MVGSLNMGLCTRIPHLGGRRMIAGADPCSEALSVLRLKEHTGRFSTKPKLLVKKRTAGTSPGQCQQPRQGD